MARRLFQYSRAPEFQSSRAPELRSSKAPELQSFRVRYALFSQFFSTWWMRTSWLVIYRFHHVAAAVDPHEEGNVFFFFFRFCWYEDDNLPRLGTQACSEKTAFSLIQQVRCLQVLANIAQVEPTWWSVTAQTLRLLEELEARQETTDASYISLTCDWLSEALKSLSACAFIRRRRFWSWSRVSQLNPSPG